LSNLAVDHLYSRIGIFLNVGFGWAVRTDQVVIHGRDGV